MNGQNSQRLLDHAKQSTAENFVKKSRFDWYIKFLIKLTGFQKIHNKIIWKTVTNKHDKEIPKERHTFPEERQKIIDDLKLI